MDIHNQKSAGQAERREGNLSLQAIAIRIHRGKNAEIIRRGK
ncbi:hypothetical protein [Lachnoclostridium edouardi]|nr:hypothetical protein [Lachnoclostridium edouardi]